MFTRNRGFTYLELTSTIAVIGVLSAVALPRMMALESDARHATLRALAGALTEASVMNGARGELRGDADRIVECHDAGRLMFNATQIEGGLLWQDRMLLVGDAAAAGASTDHRECELRDARDANAGEVRFFLRVCRDRICRQT